MIRMRQSPLVSDKMSPGILAHPAVNFSRHLAPTIARDAAAASLARSAASRSGETNRSARRRCPPEAEAFRAERIPTEFNSNATGYFDGEYFSGMAAGRIRRRPGGNLRLRRGGCCYIRLPLGRRGRAATRTGTQRFFWAAEEHARLRNRAVLFAATHSFQGRPDSTSAWATRSNPSCAIIRWATQVPVYAGAHCNAMRPQQSQPVCASAASRRVFKL